MEKPQKEIFKIALQKMGLTIPSNAVHVGNSLYLDVKGAKDAGLVPILFDPLAIIEADCTKIRALSELPQLFL